MYWWMSLSAVVRITIGIVLIFVVVPALARPRLPRDTHALERFFWNFGVGIILITLAGQLLTVVNLFSPVTLVLAAIAVIIMARSVARGKAPWDVARRGFDSALLALLNIFEGKISVPRRMRRAWRRTVAWLRVRTASAETRWHVAGWVALTAVAAAFRFYRPLASPNLGFSDTYVHLYLVKLLEEGSQVDPEWGPYPRGMHFLLLSLYYLTNVDQILLMNFFGALVGVLMTLAVADCVRRLTGSVVPGFCAGLVFATLIGGPGQYFILGGAFSTKNASSAEMWLSLPYRDLLGKGEFDLALTAFHRQTSTLSQELAIALLFPAAMFLLGYFRTRSRWQLAGFAGGTAAIAATHSGVVIPLVVMSGVAVVAAVSERSLDARAFWRGLTAGFVGVLAGSAWTLAFIVYPYSGGDAASREYDSVGTAALYYFPFLRGLANIDDTRVFVRVTPFLIVCVVLAVALIGLSTWVSRERRGALVWTGLVFLSFFLFHVADTFGLPRLIETTRNSQWLLMSIAVLAGVAVAELLKAAGGARRVRRLLPVAVGVLLVVWVSRAQFPSEPAIRQQIVDYSGHGGAALAVLQIERSLEPYTWTLVSYGQEFPMVLRRGFHVPAADFLERFDPGAPVTPIPTRHLFIIVEKTPHQFQINAWSRRFDRAELQKRLLTWVFLYQGSHSNIRVFLEDDDVRVYHIERSADEIERLTARAGI